MKEKGIGLMDRERMTDREQSVIEEIIRYQGEHGFAPTVRELGASVGLASPSSVFAHLKSLERKGYITRMPAFPRTITIL